MAEAFSRENLRIAVDLFQRKPADLAYGRLQDASGNQLVFEVLPGQPQPGAESFSLTGPIWRGLGQIDMRLRTVEPRSVQVPARAFDYEQ